jgi:hypothetical protein
MEVASQRILLNASQWIAINTKSLFKFMLKEIL